MGEWAEKYVAELYHENFFKKSPEPIFNKTKSHDFMFLTDDEPYKVEVKYDAAAKVYGNFCFEFQDHKGRDSGITATEADVVVYVLDEHNVFEFDTKLLKRFVKKEISKPNSDIRMGGDGKAFKLLIVPITRIIKCKFCIQLEIH
jgi:hypothetical protein